MERRTNPSQNDPATNKLTFFAGQEADAGTNTAAEPADVPDGTEIVAYYKRRIQGDVLVNMSDHYSGKCALYVDAFAEDKCANVFRIQFFIPKADFSGDFSIEFGDNQSVHAFEAESLSGACGSGGIGSALWTYTVFGANAEDVADGKDAG